MCLQNYPTVKLSMKRTGGIFHDRFIVLDYGTADERVFLCGASAKDAGARITSIVEDYGVSNYTPVIATLLKNPTLILPQQRGVNVLKKKTKCYIYTRVSTAIQVDGYSLDAQKDKLRKYAEFQNMEIVGEYSDEGHSGKNIKGRQEFMRMLNDIEDQINKYFGLMQMPVISSRYWNMVHGTNPDEVKQDLEGMQVMQILGNNMAYFIDCKNVATKMGIEMPKAPDFVFTNFIR